MSFANGFPDVQFKEIDKSEVVAQDGTTLAGIVITAKKGPVNRRVTINNERDYLSMFGSPVADTAIGQNALEWGYNSYAALEYLNGGGTVQVVRSASSADKYDYAGLSTGATSATMWATNATSGISAQDSYTDEDSTDYIYDVEHYSSAAAFGAAASAIYAIFALAGPGANSEGYSISVQSLSTSADWLYAYDDAIATIPSSAFSNIINNSTVLTTAATAYVPIAQKIVKVNVFSTAGGSVPVESFYGSFDASLIINNNSAYLPSVINGNSAVGLYCKIVSAPSTLAALIPWQATSAINKKTLSGGTATSACASKIGPFYSYFKTSNLAYVINANPEYVGDDAGTKIKELLDKKQNIMAIFQGFGTPDSDGAKVKATYISNLATNGSFSYNDSYSAGYVGFKQVKDSYNSKIIWLPNAISGAYANAYTDLVANVWDAPANSRGVVSCYAQLPAFGEDEIGQLYLANWNSVLKIPGEGYFVWGQKTRQRKASALDRITTRKVLNMIKKTLAKSYRPLVLSANNTAGTRLRVSNNTNDYLAGLVAAGGLTAGSCICDDSNNTPQVIDNHILAISVIIQPVMSIEYVQCNIIITRTGVSVTEALVA